MNQIKTITKPKEVSTAVTLLWVSQVFGMVVSTILLVNLDRAIRPGIILGREGAITIFILLPIYAFFLFKISQGRNWARISYFLVYFILFLWHSTWGIVFGATILYKNIIGLTDSEPYNICMLIGHAMMVYAAYLLFTNPGSLWFQKKQAKIPLNSPPTSAPQDQPSQTIQAPTAPQPITPPDSNAVLDAQAWEQVAEEMERGHYEKGLWAKNLVAANGDEAKAKLQYMQARQQQIYANLMQIQTAKQLENGGGQRRGKCTCGEGSGGRHWRSCELATAPLSH